MSARRDPIEYGAASAEVRAVYDDIMATRKIEWVNNFWKVLAHDPPTLKRIWSNIKQVMGPGSLDPLTSVVFAGMAGDAACDRTLPTNDGQRRIDVIPVSYTHLTLPTILRV